MTSKQVVATDEAPAAIGPYSQAIKTGDWLFFSGQLGLDAVSGDLVEGGIAAQTEQVMANIGAILKAAGLDFNSIVKTTIYLVDLQDFGTVNEIYGRCFSADSAPVRATVQVAALPKKALIEIEGMARVC